LPLEKEYGILAPVIDWHETREWRLRKLP